MSGVLKSSLPLILMVAIAALGLGIWLGSERHDSHDQVVVEELDLSEFLQQEYSNSRGDKVAVKSVLGQLTLVNFWATWCAPCRHEMPVFEALYQQFKTEGFAVVGLTLDDPEPTEIFLQDVGITYPALMLDDTGWELLGRFGNPQGLLPYSVLIDAQGVVLERKLGEIDAQLLSDWIEKHLK